MSSVWALQDAKNKLSAVVDRACDIEPQIVTRRGVPVAVLVSYESYRAQTPRTPSFVDVLLGGPKFDDGLRIERDHTPLRKTEIAATAKVDHLTLVTRNVKDLAYMGVKLFNPFQ